MNKEFFKTYGLILFLTVVAFGIAFQFAEPAPPRKVVMATGLESGAYYKFALRYRDYFAQNGIQLEVLQTSGSVENLELLKTHGKGVDIIFAQTGTGDPAATPDFTSVASVFYEPLWVFYRGEQPIQRLVELKGKRVAVGAEGSGTRMVSLKILSDNGLTVATTQILSLGGNQAAEALKTSQIDAAFFVGAPEAPVINDLLRSEGIRLMNFERVEAYKSRYRYFSSVILYEGVVDMQKNIPAEDVVLLASTASIVVRENFHPALVNLLLQAANEIHRKETGMLEKTGQFPSSDFIQFPLNDEAVRYFRFGPSFLTRHLPFWAATAVDRLKFVLLPLLTMLIPLLRIAPPIYAWRTRRKIYTWYGMLIALENKVVNPEQNQDFAQILVELDDLEREVAKIVVPLSYTDEVYNLRLHIRLVREKAMEPRTKSE
ncbi:MAG TPA: TAXI family TRAP transporter solute-binding subunit [Acidobacteriota bacterium]|nr:TAXI family TRAP transporter solute-binding subunit [Acidobacteriota bacterium]HMZ82536.1 TAXI family TRAP transporter solute-binding subunit [Acidobacteriota bacterium]HNB74381.1 TAXI family TRAP transporter solute-binding subunit [Acidobacteriota bacterium]HNJ43280.1 TAXI family TRAP transporter solute-binding subunit [Acidobacteriota bacterium]